MARLRYWFCLGMLAAARFEYAITPAHAGHRPQLRLDIEHWEQAVHRSKLRVRT